jgi:hypothetical protein
MKSGSDSRTQKEDKNFAEVAEETEDLFGFPFAPSAKPLRPLRPAVRFRILTFEQAHE